MTVFRATRNVPPAAAGESHAPIRPDVPLWSHGDPEQAARQYDQLRRRAPLVRVAGHTPDDPLAVLRHGDVLAILRDDNFRVAASEKVTGVSWIDRVTGTAFLTGGSMATSDGAAHRRLRRAVADWFRPDMVARHGPALTAAAERLLDAAKRIREIDLVADFAAPFAAAAIAVVLGLPAGDAAAVRARVAALTEAAERRGRAGRVLRRVRLARALRRALRRATPSGLLEHLKYSAGLASAEVMPMTLLLLFAGQETIVGAIANGTLSLAEHPEQRALLARRTDLIAPAVEELLRFAGPVESAGFRFARSGAVLGGMSLSDACPVVAVIASANRDPAVFADADALDLARSPNPHLAFGAGAHHCLGAGLARLSLQIAFERMMVRWPDLKITVPRSSLVWRRTRGLQSPARLPARL
jgi:cytochrome P450 PksS